MNYGTNGRTNQKARGTRGKDICASRLCFLASVAASYFSGEDWLLSGSSTATLALGWGAANTANNLWLTGCHPKLEMLVPHGSSVIETRNAGRRRILVVSVFNFLWRSITVLCLVHLRSLQLGNQDSYSSSRSSGPTATDTRPPHCLCCKQTPLPFGMPVVYDASWLSSRVSGGQRSYTLTYANANGHIG